MEKHIILNAFGTSTQAQISYDHLHALIAPHFADCQFHWTYTSPVIRQTVNKRGGSHVYSLPELISQLNGSTKNHLVIQSMHVLPGHEFHRMVRESRQATVPSAIGMPLLTTPDDYLRVSDDLMELIGSNKKRAVLILGHGTTHPCWTGYLALERILRKRAGSHIFVAALENFPHSHSIIDEIISRGFVEILLIPFLMVAGMHFLRDINGNSPRSWKSLCAKHNISLILHDQGLAMLPCIADIFSSHIKHALGTLHQQI
jgi:sirohydrochlorin cobaltochelatase